MRDAGYEFQVSSCPKALKLDIGNSILDIGNL
jgi:hypothetical protein